MVLKARSLFFFTAGLTTSLQEKTILSHMPVLAFSSEFLIRFMQ